MNTRDEQVKCPFREIPEISNRELGYRARLIRPVIALNRLPEGRWPNETTETFFMRMPKNLREENFLRQGHKGSPVRFVQETKLTTFHSPGSAGRVFHPTIAEVMAQIPAQYLNANRRKQSDKWAVVGFSTFLENHDPEYDTDGNFHVATTVLLYRSSGETGEYMVTFHQ